MIRSLRERAVLLNVLDIEASGFGAGSYPIEIGVAMPGASSYCSLIRPCADWTHWDTAAEEIHGISRDLLQRNGRDAAEVARVLNELLADSTVYCDAWGMDSSWLARLFDAADCSQHFRLESIRSLLSEEQLPYWHAMKDKTLRESRARRHRASTDARVIQDTYARLLALSS